ncbi:uncharacterized protein NS506_07148 [Nocardia seriolae]|uniref:Membrane protein n=1 Tax=Nocardia seriolae TaxID=37332 RepID=A0ABC9YR60_9NOCA|nr:uncharacterized protein NS506_07148 [Nocardia seriolae]GEM23516.1 hypothetical protein NS2_17550 [Nocardia seriolae NBRC 15557]BEK90753.1 DUF3817 domain-containing protein [Nocardia seriolae]BEK93525.1 DUF3817 domain-containing protein [Nocardia seriolae]GAM45850.1 hypothetical protein NS07_v2contig00020-0040 [Nocardia seriolae]
MSTSDNSPASPVAGETTVLAPRPLGAAAPEKIRGALIRYRVLAYITGVWLLVLCGEMIYKYAILDDSSTAPHWLFYIGQVHGIFYMIYLVFTIDLGIKARWKPLTTALTCLAGTIPFASFVFEHYRTREVKALTASPRL